MTIAQAFNEIAIAQGGTASTSGTIAGAIDALNDALAGSDQASAQTIEDAVRLLGQNIGGGSSVTVESLTATENKTYTAPEGKAYSPVTVNVSGGASYDGYFFIGVDQQTGVLDKTFSEISAALDDTDTQILILAGKMGGNPVTFAVDGTEEGYMVIAFNIYNATQEFAWKADSADGYPAPYQAGGN